MDLAAWIDEEKVADHIEQVGGQISSKGDAGISGGAQICRKDNSKCFSYQSQGKIPM